MTPAINAAERAGIVFKTHSYQHNPDISNYGNEAATELAVDGNRVFKTLVANISGELVVGIVPTTRKLNLKALAKAMGSKKAEMADIKKAEKSSGYVAGGISPLGQRKPLRTCIDCTAFEYETIYISGGRRGLEIELRPEDLKTITHAINANIAG